MAGGVFQKSLIQAGHAEGGGGARFTLCEGSRMKRALPASDQSVEGRGRAPAPRRQLYIDLAMGCSSIRGGGRGRERAELAGERENLEAVLEFVGLRRRDVLRAAIALDVDREVRSRARPGLLDAWRSQSAGHEGPSRTSTCRDGGAALGVAPFGAFGWLDEAERDAGGGRAG